MKFENKIAIITSSKFGSNLRLSTLVELLELDKTKDLIGLNFNGSSMCCDDLSNFNFTDCTFKGSDFMSAILVNTNFTNCCLKEANFQNTNLTGTNFTKAKLAKATFYEAKFINTIFTESDYTW
jgi:uncharacterized protein YjbI with pentapeptide repeats